MVDYESGLLGEVVSPEHLAVMEELGQALKAEGTKLKADAYSLEGTTDDELRAAEKQARACERGRDCVKLTPKERLAATRQASKGFLGLCIMVTHGMPVYKVEARLWRALDRYYLDLVHRRLKNGRRLDEMALSKMAMRLLYDGHREPWIKFGPDEKWERWEHKGYCEAQAYNSDFVGATYPDRRDRIKGLVTTIAYLLDQKDVRNLSPEHVEALELCKKTLNVPSYEELKRRAALCYTRDR